MTAARRPHGLARRWATAASRTYLRRAPWTAGKSSLWDNVVHPHLAWHDHGFRTTTAFGAVVEGRTSELLQQYVYFFGVWEPNLTAFLAGRLRPGDGFVDVGANIGYHTLLASRAVGPSGNVVAIEAVPSIFAFLTRHLTINRADNVRAVNLAVSDARARVMVYPGPASHIGISTIFADGRTTPEAEVATDTLDSVLSPSEAATARIVKIDVEGAEAMVLDGMEGLLEDGRADLEVVVEVGPERLRGQGRSVGEIFTRMERFGYNPYALANHYDAGSYIRRQLTRPTRLLEVPAGETDVVFSRVDALSL